MVDDCDEPFKVFRSETRKARKANECGECGRVIVPGETYRWATGLSDKSWDTYRICAHCWVAADWLIRECGGFLYHGVLEDIQEHVEEYQRADLARLLVGMRRKWERFAGGLMAMPPAPKATA